MKNFLRKMVPSFVLRPYYSFKYKTGLKKYFRYDWKRYAELSRRQDIMEGELALIMMAAHGIEKGLTMPAFRYKFGQDKMIFLIRRVNDYLRNFGTDDRQIFDILTIICEYKKCHVDAGLWQEISEELREKTDDLLSRYPDVKADQIQLSATKEDYFRQIDSPFPEFAWSRHSVRSFSGESVNLEDVKAAVDLARCAPSACNRQPTRVFIVKDREMVAKIFELQGGNKGFGHTVDKLIIMTGSISGYTGGIERNWVYVDVGLFTMNLVYALHAKKIGTCILNWNMDPNADRKLRTLINIPDQDTVVLFIACGMVPENFKICRSQRKPVDKYLTVI